MAFEKITYYLTTRIKYVVASDRVVIMDLRTGNYILFDQVASDMWIQLLSTTDFNNCICFITDKYSIESSECEHDFLGFIESCKARGLIATMKPHESNLVKQTIQKKSVTLFSAWSCIHKTKKELKQLGFPALYEQYRQFSKPVNSFSSDYLLTDALVTFRKAENFFQVSNAHFDCLPRSLSLFKFLISIGIHCDHCIGIQRFPFGAHAWVEVRNIVVGDDDVFISKFSVINRI